MDFPAPVAGVLGADIGRRGTLAMMHTTTGATQRLSIWTNTQLFCIPSSLVLMSPGARFRQLLQFHVYPLQFLVYSTVCEYARSAISGVFVAFVPVKAGCNDSI